MENQNVPQAPVQGQQVIVVKNNFWKGFFVGILTVLVIVGAWFAVTIFILTSVVTSSLDSARIKSSIAYVRASLASTRAQAEIYYDTTGSYTGVCESDQFSTSPVAELKKMAQVNDVSCFADKDSYVISSTVKDSSDNFQTICADSNGALETVPGNDPATSANDFCK